MNFSDDALNDLYKKLPNEEPSEALDNKILLMANKQAIVNKPNSSKKIWLWASGVAASALLITLLTVNQTNIAPSEEAIVFNAPEVNQEVLGDKANDAIPMARKVEPAMTKPAESRAREAKNIQSDEALDHDYIATLINEISHESGQADKSEQARTKLFTYLHEQKKYNNELQIPAEYLTLLSEDQRAKLKKTKQD